MLGTMPRARRRSDRHRALQQTSCKTACWPPHWLQDADLEAIRGLMDGIGSCNHAATAPDQSVADWLRSRGASASMLSIADACYANDFGCSLEDLGLRECILENQRWDAGQLSSLPACCCPHAAHAHMHVCPMQSSVHRPCCDIW